MDVSNYTISQFFVNTFFLNREKLTALLRKIVKTLTSLSKIDLFFPLRYWLRHIKIDDVQFAHNLCHIIPSQCPFERDITVFGKVIFHIPPMCKLNPFYEELMELRFRSLCYLADECGEDISKYC